MVKDNDIKVIVNCAAYTNVDKAEADVDFAERRNAKAVMTLANAIKECKGMLIHYFNRLCFWWLRGQHSTTEEDYVNPIGVYGLTRLHGGRQSKTADVAPSYFALPGFIPSMVRILSRQC